MTTPRQMSWLATWWGRVRHGCLNSHCSLFIAYLHLTTLPLPPHNYVYWNYFTERILPYCSKNVMASNCQLQWLTGFSLFCQFESYYIGHGNRIFSPITAEHTCNSPTYSFQTRGGGANESWRLLQLVLVGSGLDRVPAWLGKSASGLGNLTSNDHTGF